MKTVASVLTNIHANIFGLAIGSGATWSLVTTTGDEGTPFMVCFSTSAFLVFSSISVSDMLSKVLSELLDSLRELEAVTV